MAACGASAAISRCDAHSRASASAPKRVAFFYVPNGVAQEAWHPKETGYNFALSPTLKPLAPVREKVSLFTNLDRIKVPGTDGHAQAGACYLSTAAPDELSPAGYPLKRTIDQVIADTIGNTTPFRSLELSCNSFTDNKESVYFDNISWYGHGHVARSIKDPRKVFRRLFNVKEHQANVSVLDLVRADAKDLKGRLGRLIATTRRVHGLRANRRTADRAHHQATGGRQRTALSSRRNSGPPCAAMNTFR